MGDWNGKKYSGTRRRNYGIVRQTPCQSTKSRVGCERGFPLRDGEILRQEWAVFYLVDRQFTGPTRVGEQYIYTDIPGVEPIWR